MPLPEDFRFSQASLQDFVACPRRFQLRYLLKLKWPAVEAEPIEEYERRMAQGMAYHQMMQQHVIGIPEEQIGRSAQDPDLRDWWQNTLVYRPVATFGGDRETAILRSEVSLVGQVAGYRLIAKYDLLIVEPGKNVVILDWKTSEKRTPEWLLRERLQSQVYPFVVVQAGGHLYGETPVSPEHVEMVYWFPKFPQSPARLRYSAVQYQKDAAHLAELVGRVSRMEDEDFYLTEDVQQCVYCPYRSYCERGVKAGALDDVAAAVELEAQAGDLDIDFEQIAEIQF